MKIAKHLSQQIGPRVSGSPKELEAVKFIEAQFRKLKLDTKIQKFKYLGWVQDAGPTLSILTPFKSAIPAASMAYTGSTPPGGAEGTLKHYGTFSLFPNLLEPPKYTLFDQSGEPSGHVLVLPGKETRPIPNPWLQVLQDPIILVCEEDFRPLQKAIEANEQVRAHIVSTAKYVQSFTSYNMIATLPGESQGTVVVGGHHDSIEGSPGAIDNAAGVEAIFRLARKLLEKKLKYTIKFITWGGHEWGLYGSQYFVKDAKESGFLRNIKACLTLDVLGCGDYLRIWSGPRLFRQWVESVLGDSKLSEKREIRFEDSLVGSDDWSFSVEGIPGTMLMDWPLDTLHLPADSYETIDEEKLAFGTEAAHCLIKDMEGTLDQNFSTGQV